MKLCFKAGKRFTGMINEAFGNQVLTNSNVFKRCGRKHFGGYARRKRSSLWRSNENIKTIVVRNPPQCIKNVIRRDGNQEIHNEKNCRLRLM